METAGKQVDDEDLRELMKENGIGRPSTRANIFKRQYIVRKKQVLPATGIQLIGTIQNDLVSGINGSWEKQLKILKRNFYRCSVYQQHETNGRCFSL
jgi:DNA topoisomerase IA